MIPMSESEYRMLNNTPSEGDLFNATNNATSGNTTINFSTPSTGFQNSRTQRLRNFITTRRNWVIAFAVTLLVIIVAVIAISVGVSKGRGDDSSSGGNGNGSKSAALYGACSSSDSSSNTKPLAPRPKYTLAKEFVGDDFFSYFDFFTYDDPTNGYVNYVSSDEAASLGLTEIRDSGDDKQVYIGTDSTNVVANDKRGRDSVRIQTKEHWNASPSLLFLLDIEHMPAACGAWPAWWLVGPNWPTGGEIDIIEGVNLNQANQMALHTGPDCNMNDQGKMGSGDCFSGHWAAGVQQTVPATNCYVEDDNQWYNQGCSQIWTNETFGASVNAKKGGVYALEWSLIGTTGTGYIRSFFLPREFVEKNKDKFEGNAPLDTSTWGAPQSAFVLDPTDCKHTNFKDLSIVINLTFCGDWASEDYNWSKCKEKTKVPKCGEFVKNNPEAFKEAYWLINSLRVYQGLP